MDYISGGDRNQIKFFALEEMVAADSWARMIDTFVDLLPLKELGFKHTSLHKEGRPPYDPSQLLKPQLAKDLRKYTKAPTQSLLDLSELTKKTYPQSFVKKPI